MLTNVAEKEGALNIDRKYEAFLPVVVAVRCFVDNSISNFWLLSNAEDFGDFDDLILSIEYKNGNKKLYCVQMKHKYTHSISIQDLIKEHNGYFSLNKYKDSYQKIKDNCGKLGHVLENTKPEDIELVIYTNTEFIEEDKDERLIAKKCEFKIGENLFKTCDKKYEDCVFAFENGTTTQFDEELLKKVCLYTRQAHSDSIENLVLKELSPKFQHITGKEIENLLMYFADWATGNLGKQYLMEKSEVEMKLLEILLWPYLIFPNFAQIPAPTNITFWKNFVDAILTCDFTLLESDINIEIFSSAIYSHLISTDIWKSYKHETIFKKHNLGEIIVKRKKIMGDLLPLHVYLAMWEIREIPLIIKSPDTASTKAIKNIFNLLNTYKRKFCIVSCDIHEDCIPTNSTSFTNVNILPDHLTKSLCESIRISLQGRTEISMRNLIPTEETTIYNQLSPSLLFKLLSSAFEIGRAPVKFPYYIPRRFNKIILNTSILTEEILEKKKQDERDNRKEEKTEKKETMLFFIFCKNPRLLMTKLNIEDFTINLEETVEFTPTEEKFIVLQTDHSQKFDLIMNKMGNNAKFHALEFNETINVFEWLFSTAPIEKLRPYLIQNTTNNDDYLVNEVELVKHYKSHCHIVSNNAGMGKSTVLYHLAEICKSNIWVLHINLPQHVQFINSIKDFNCKEIMYHFLDLPETGKDFSISIFEYKLRKREVLILVDGYDEIQSESNKMGQFLDVLYNFKTEMWIVTRSVSQKKLEDKFNTLSLSLSHFTETDQLLFFKNFLQIDASQEEFQEILQTIRISFNSFKNELIGIPLQSRMIADILNLNGIGLFKNKNFTIADLYDTFIEISSKNDKNIKSVSNLTLMPKLALSLFFENSILREIIDLDEFLKCKEEFIDEIKSEKRQFILSGFNDKGRPVFSHRTYAEFLVAKWMADNLDKESVKTLIKEKIFYKELIVVRQFFDGILSQGHPLHQAVLSNDIENLKSTLENNGLTDLDKCGRTALHLAASYGKIMDFTVSDECWGILNKVKRCEIKTTGTERTLDIPYISNFQSNGEQIFNLILEAAVNKNFEIITKSDDLKLNASEYAFKSGCLRNLNQLRQHSFVAEELIKSNNLFFLLHCFENGLNNLLMDSQLYCLCRIQKDGRSILHLAVQYCDEYVVYKLLSVEMNSCEYLNKNISDLIKFHNLIETVFKRSDKMVVKLIQTFLNLDWNINMLSCCQVEVLVKRRKAFKELLDLGVDVKNDFGSRVLRHAATIGDIECLQLLLNAGAPIDARDSNIGYTPLFYAVEHDKVECVRVLLQKGASVNIKNWSGRTPLTLSVLFGYKECTNLLLEYTSFSDDFESVALCSAAEIGDVECLKLLLEAGASINVKNELGCTPLYLAAENDAVECVRALLEKGAYTNIETNDGETPLSISVYNGHTECTKLLLEYNSLSDIQTKSIFNSLIEAVVVNNPESVQNLLKGNVGEKLTKKNIYNVLYLTAKIGPAECMKHILEAGAKELDSRELSMILCQAVQNKHHDCVQVLLKYITLTYEIYSIFGDTTLHMAVKNNDPKMVTLLLQSEEIRKHIDFKNYNSRSALHLAAKDGYQECVEQLIQNGAKTDNVNVQNETPLWLAFKNNQTSCIGTLINLGALKNTGELHIATARNNTSFLGMLMENGANINYANELGNTPLHIACKNNNYDSFLVLLNSGANINAVNGFGITPLYYACYEGHYEIVKKLLEFKNTLEFNNLNLKVQKICDEEITAVNAVPATCTPVDSNENKKNQEIYRHVNIEKLRLERICDNIFLNDNIKQPQLQQKQQQLDEFIHLIKLVQKGFNELHISILKGHNKIAKALIENGFPVNSIDNEGRTPIYCAIELKNGDLFEKLLQNGALINIYDCNKDTPLNYACTFNWSKCVEKLLDHKANLSKFNSKGCLPIHTAAYCGSTESLCILIEMGGCDVNVPDLKGRTSLHYSAEKSSSNLNLLLKYGAIINLVDNEGKTPLHYSISGNSIECLKKLLSCGGTYLLNIPDKNKQVPLHYAVLDGKTELAKILLENGADANYCNIRNEVSLHIAAKFGHLDCVKVLLKFEANVNVRDHLNLTPLMNAAAACNSEIVELLLKNRADPSVKNREGKTAEDMIGTGTFNGPNSYDIEKNKCLELLSCFKN